MTRSPARRFVFGIARRVPFFSDTPQWSSDDRVRRAAHTSTEGTIIYESNPLATFYNTTLCQSVHYFELLCRRSGNGGPQTCLPAAHGVALLAGLCGPSSSTRNQDPREGPSLARRMTQGLLKSGLTRLAREGRRVQGQANLARFS